MAIQVSSAALIAALQRSARFTGPNSLGVKVVRIRWDGMLRLNAASEVMAYEETVPQASGDEDFDVLASPVVLAAALKSMARRDAPMKVAHVAGKHLAFSVGRSSAKVPVSTGTGPRSPRACDQWSPAPGLAAVAQATSWACANPAKLGSDQMKLAGTHLDGEWAVATDTYQAARHPFASHVFASTPMTLDLSVIPMVVEGADCFIGTGQGDGVVIRDASRIVEVAPYAGQYPQVSRLFDLVRPAGFVEVTRAVIVEVCAMAKSIDDKRDLRLRFRAGDGRLQVDCLSENGEVRSELDDDEVHQEGEPRHWEISPSYLTDALEGLRSDVVRIVYGTEKGKPLMIEDTSTPLQALVTVSV